MPIHSKNKGKRGELEVAHFLTDRGFPARRGQQVKGTEDSPDVECIPLDDYHIEVKFTERFNLYAALNQAMEDAPGKIPLVIHRRKRQPWVAVLPLSDFLDLLNEPRITDSSSGGSIHRQQPAEEDPREELV